MSVYDSSEIIKFWFNDESKAMWFNSSPLFDAELKEKFEATFLAAEEGELSDWEQSAQGILALVILLDQFPLNMYRGDARCFSTEQRSRNLVSKAIDEGLDDDLSDDEKSFLYMPFMHSEDLIDQNRAINLFEDAGLSDVAKFARHHRDIVQRFGRFPHRNSILNRENTEAEKNYLVSGEAFLG